MKILKLEIEKAFSRFYDRNASTSLCEKEMHEKLDAMSEAYIPTDKSDAELREIVFARWSKLIEEKKANET